MASNYNRTNSTNQRGVPANQAGGNSRRPRPRDYERMRSLNDARHQQNHGDGGWADTMRNEAAYEEAMNRTRRPAPSIPSRQQPQDRAPWRPRGPPRVRPAPEVQPSTVETPASDEPMYSGNNRGSKPTKRTLGQNMEFAGFIPLVQQTYDRMAVEDQQLARKLPYAIFQHAMVEFLIAYQLHHAKYTLKVPSLQSLMDPLAAISAESCNIPVPIFDYICGVGPAMTPAGDKVYWNLPSAAIPRGEYTFNNHAVRPGSFGPVTAELHNVYECYVSPFVTSEYVIRTAAHPSNSRRWDWLPFPAGWYPANGVANQNLLGYRELQKLHPDAIRKCIECDFDTSEAITGLMCHSAYAMNLTSGVLGAMSSIKTTKADFKMKDNSAAFVYKERVNEPNDAAILWDEPATLKSPFAFSATAANRANYSAYKRRRDRGAPGTCFLVAGVPPPGWVETINSNFEIAEAFALQRGFRDRPSLRADDHEEEEGLGTVTQDVFHWLETSFLIKK